MKFRKPARIRFIRLLYTVDIAGYLKYHEGALMPQDSTKNRAENKAFEVGYILLRVAERMRQRSLKERLEYQAIALIEQVCVSTDEAIKTTRALEQLLRLGGEMGYIHKPSTEVLIAELAKINSAIAELTIVQPIEAEMRIFKSERKEAKKESGNSELKVDNTIRQSAIADRIRQLGSCGMKDIQIYFPEISERTLRYDLGKLVEQGLLERLGSGGPNTFYKVREARAIQVVPEEHEV